MMTAQFKAVVPVLAIICVVGLALAWLGVLPGFAREEETADGKAATPTSTVQSPSMNATEPASTQTATFALG